jgi:hypothetical protein
VGLVELAFGDSGLGLVGLEEEVVGSDYFSRCRCSVFSILEAMVGGFECGVRFRLWCLGCWELDSTMTQRTGQAG